MNEFLDAFRAEHPEYNDMSDIDLAKALHAKFYSDMPLREFFGKIKMNSGPTEIPETGLTPKAGGVLDFMAAALLPMAKFTPGGMPNAAEGMLAPVRERAPEATATAGRTIPLVASSLATAGLGRAIGAARGAGGPLAQAAVGRAADANSFGVPLSAPAQGGKAMSSILEMMKNKWVGPAVGAAGYDIIRRLTR